MSYPICINSSSSATSIISQSYCWGEDGHTLAPCAQGQLTFSGTQFCMIGKEQGKESTCMLLEFDRIISTFLMPH